MVAVRRKVEASTAGALAPPGSLSRLVQPCIVLKKKNRGSWSWGETGSSRLRGSGVPASRDAQFWGRAAQTDRVQTDASHDGPEAPDHAQMLGGVWLWPQLTKLFGNVAVYVGNENR